VTWLALIEAALMALAGFAGFLKNRQLLDAGAAEQVSRALAAALDDIAKAKAAREAVRRDAVRDPRGLREDDGFRRSD
jgi:hypothetical protein